MLNEGHVQLSLFDEKNLLEIECADYPGERFIVCRFSDDLQADIITDERQIQTFYIDKKMYVCKYMYISK
ncbi:hypothetical protein AGMMS50276_00520 [Synergistales bacterium]|nr:hypothetical protein AGMMS50276_00520 [Synergistales bacterium]